MKFFFEIFLKIEILVEVLSVRWDSQKSRSNFLGWITGSKIWNHIFIVGKYEKIVNSCGNISRFSGASLYQVLQIFYICLQHFWEGYCYYSYFSNKSKIGRVIKITAQYVWGLAESNICGYMNPTHEWLHTYWPWDRDYEFLSCEGAPTCSGWYCRRK